MNVETRFKENDIYTDGTGNEWKITGLGYNEDGEEISYLMDSVRVEGLSLHIDEKALDTWDGVVPEYKYSIGDGLYVRPCFNDHVEVIGQQLLVMGDNKVVFKGLTTQNLGTGLTYTYEEHLDEYKRADRLEGFFTPATHEVILEEEPSNEEA